MTAYHKTMLTAASGLWTKAKGKWAVIKLVPKLQYWPAIKFASRAKGYNPK